MEPLLWLLLMTGLSPVWLDWARHLLAEPAARYAAVFLPISVLLFWRDDERGQRRAWGLWVVACALLVCMLSVGGGVTRVGRLCLPVAVMGMAAWRGRPRVGLALGSLWWVPVPSALVKASGKLLAVLPTGALELESMDAGLPLAALLSGLAFHAALWRHDSVRRALGRAVAAGCIALLIQVVAVALAIGAASLLPTSGLRVALDLLPVWVVLALLGAVWLPRAPRPRRI